MTAALQTSEPEIYSVFDQLSDAVLLVDARGRCLYRNAGCDALSEHLIAAAIDMCFCDWDTTCGDLRDYALARQAELEGWRVSCAPFQGNKVIVCKYNDKLGNRIQVMREDFARAHADGTPLQIAAIKALRAQVSYRWLTIGHFDWSNERILFDNCYDGNDLQSDGLPPLYRNPDFKACAQMVVTDHLDECFSGIEPYARLGMTHMIGMALKNHLDECVGYALLGHEGQPGDVREASTLLHELAVLYGPYFEVKSAKQIAQKAQIEANTDVVTGKGNRRACETFLQECLDQMEHEEQEDAVLAMFNAKAARNSILMLVDFDGFKRINDTLGHEAGDRALRSVADKLERLGNDEARVFRMGGDELVQIFPRAGDLEAENLRFEINLIEKELQQEGFAALGLSIGVVNFFEGNGTVQSLMTLADARMYQDKKLRSLAFL